MQYNKYEEDIEAMLSMADMIFGGEKK